MKEILMKIMIEGDDISTTIRTRGFEQTAESSLTIIGVLENVKNLECEKLKAISKIRAKQVQEDEGNGI